jgi:hypothetical protein
MYRCTAVAMVSLVVLSGVVGIQTSSLRDAGGPMPRLVVDAGGPMPRLTDAGGPMPRLTDAGGPMPRLVL